ncbi:uncharacterized protein [Ptychodera flava]|uniref:uncharacterized protein n=1 Tax=Ptychodera flava TaxID=63121 RepID=UPI00396A3D6C
MSNTEREDFDIGEWCKSKGLSNETIGKLVENEVTTKGTLESLTETDIIDLKLIIGQRALFRRAQKKMTSAEVRLEVPKEGSEEMKSHLNNLCHSPPSMHHDEASKMANTDRPTPAGVSKSETDPLPVSVEEDTKTENVQKKTQSDCEEDMDEGVSNPHEG